MRPVRIWFETKRICIWSASQSVFKKAVWNSYEQLYHYSIHKLDITIDEEHRYVLTKRHPGIDFQSRLHQLLHFCRRFYSQ